MLIIDLVHFLYDPQTSSSWLKISRLEWIPFKIFSIKFPTIGFFSLFFFFLRNNQSTLGSLIQFYLLSFIKGFVVANIYIYIWLLTITWDVKIHPIKKVSKTYLKPQTSWYPSLKKLVLENCINLPNHQLEFIKNLNFLV